MTNKDTKFFIFTQGGGYPSQSAPAQTSAVRSYLATQQHAQRRQNRSSARDNVRVRSRRRKENEQAAPLGLAGQNDTPGDGSLGLETGSMSPLPLPAEDDLAPMRLDLTFSDMSSMLVSFPLDLTPEEGYSVQFFLEFGQQKLFGTSTKIKYCTPLDLARSLMQIDPVYVLAHVVLGELFLSEYAGKPVRPFYYARSAQMYRAVNSVLANNETTFCHKLWAVIQIAMVERTVRRHDLQAVHNKALDDLFESHGGVFASYDARPDDTYLEISSRLYAAPFARTAVISPAIRQFTIVKTRFVSALSEIQTRLDLLYSGFTSRNIAPMISPPQLNRLQAYLDTLSQNHYNGSTIEDYSEYELAALFCLLSISRTFVDCPCSQETILEFLSQVQGCLDANAHSTTPGVNVLHPAAMSYGISCVRSEIFPDHHSQTEFKISQTLADAHKLFYLANPPTRTRIFTWLIACISTTAYLAGHSIEFKNEIERVKNFDMQMLDNELELSWTMKTQQDLS